MVQRYAEDRGISARDAVQTLMQVVVLRHLSLEGAQLIGGTALVLGHGNPRFSEDVDLTGVMEPRALESGLKKAAIEIEGWLNAPAVLSLRKPHGRTWRMTCRLSRAESLQLHVDTQPLRGLTTQSIIIRYPSISPFACAAVTVNEIMADKIVAVAYRRYLGGRDLFDLWFHWLGSERRVAAAPEIQQQVKAKLAQRSFSYHDFFSRLEARGSPQTSLVRSREEWRRYLTAPFKKEAVLTEITTAFRQLPEIFRDRR